MAPVTVLLPFHNSSATLDEAIKSIYQQTFREWKLLLINNNADPDSVNIATEWTKKDIRIKLINENQQGIAFALNNGLKHCNSKYVARMDADDISYPERLQKQFIYLESNPSIDVVSCQTDFHSSLDSSEGFEKFTTWQNNLITDEEHYLNRFVESPVAHPSVMFRMELIYKYGMYSHEELPEDYELWLRWMHQGKKFYKLPEKLISWNDHENRLTRKHPNYTTEKFDEVKITYLSRWIKNSFGNELKIIICGSGKNAKERCRILLQNNIPVYAITDVKKRNTGGLPHIEPEEIFPEKNLLVINFISKRGTGKTIRDYFLSKNFTEGKDFILAG